MVSMGFFDVLAGLFQPLLNMIGLGPGPGDKPMHLGERIGSTGSKLKFGMARKREARYRTVMEARAKQAMQAQAKRAVMKRRPTAIPLTRRQIRPR